MSQLTFTTQAAPSSITASPATYNLAVDEGTIVGWTLPDGYSDWTASVVHSSNCNGIIALDMYQGKYLLFGAAPGTCTLTIYSPDGTKSTTATVNVTQSAALSRVVDTGPWATRAASNSISCVPASA